MPDIWTNVVIALVTALVSTTAALVALVRFYLPRHDRIIHNPIELEAIRAQLQKVNERLVEHGAQAEGWHREVMAALVRLEDKISKKEG